MTRGGHEHESHQSLRPFYNQNPCPPQVYVETLLLCGEAVSRERGLRPINSPDPSNGRC